MSGADAGLCQAMSYMPPERAANAAAIQNQDATAGGNLSGELAAMRSLEITKPTAH